MLKEEATVCHQFIVREAARQNESGLFEYQYPQADLSRAEVREINYLTASPIILQHEWLGNMPLPKSVRKIHGVFLENHLGGCVVYVEPSTRAFNNGYARRVLQLNRGACVYWTPKNTASFLIGKSLRLLAKEGIICVLAYCTPEAGEYGTIYQACNFWYVGNTQASTMYFLDGRWISERTLADKKSWAKNKDQRWQSVFNSLPSKPVLPKFKYVKLIGNKYENKHMAEEFGWTPWPYPKRDACPQREITPAQSGFVLVKK